MRTLAPLTSLALALTLTLSALASPVRAQRMTVPFHGGTLHGELILPIVFEGRPAILLVGNGVDAFVRYYTVRPSPLFKPGSANFHIVGAYLTDTRRCAWGKYHTQGTYVYLTSPSKRAFRRSAWPGS